MKYTNITEYDSEDNIYHIYLHQTDDDLIKVLEGIAERGHYYIGKSYYHGDEAFIILDMELVDNVWIGKPNE